MSPCCCAAGQQRPQQLWWLTLLVADSDLLSLRLGLQQHGQGVHVAVGHGSLAGHACLLPEALVLQQPARDLMFLSLPGDHVRASGSCDDMAWDPRDAEQHVCAAQVAALGCGQGRHMQGEGQRAAHCRDAFNPVQAMPDAGWTGQHNKDLPHTWACSNRWLAMWCVVWAAVSATTTSGFCR